MAALQPSLLSVESLPEFTSSDVALGVTLSPRGNELAVHTALFSERTAKGTGNKTVVKRPQLPNQDTVYLAKWGAMSSANVQFYSEAFVTFTHLQESVIQREKDEIPFESSQNVELMNRYAELYIDNLQGHVGRLAVVDPFNASAYFRWASVNTTLQLLQILVTSPSGLLGGLVGEELLLWLNVNFVAPTTDDGRRYASKEKPWLEKGYWNYLVRSTIRGLSKGAMHFFTNLSKHPSPSLRHIAASLPKILQEHPRASNFSTEHEFFTSMRRWKDSVRILRNEVQMLDESEGRGDWREGLEDLVGVLEGKQDVIMRVCAGDYGGSGWREVFGVWGLWVQQDFRRSDWPDTLAIINDVVPLDSSQVDEKAQAALVSEQFKRFLHLAADLEPWLAAHSADLLEKLGIVMYDTPVKPDRLDDLEEQPPSDPDVLKLRDYLIMDFVSHYLHADPTLWSICCDYYASCGEVGKQRLGATIRRIAVDVAEEPPATRQSGMVIDGALGLAGDEGSDGEQSEGLGKLTGMDRVQKLITLCKEYELWDEHQSLCKVVAQLLVQQRRYGDAVPYCIYADDYKTISRIVDILLDEYIEKGADEFIALVDNVPDVSDVLLNSPSFDLGGTSTLAMTAFKNRLSFLERYAAYHKLFRAGNKREAARTLMLMINSEVVPKWWWGVILVDAAGMCEGDDHCFEERDAYDLLRYLEEIHIRTEQGCGSDYLGALERMMDAEEKKGGVTRQHKEDDAIKQLEVVRLALARYLARSFTMQKLY